MSGDMWKESKENLKALSFIRSLLICGFIILSGTLFPGLVVNGQNPINPVEAKSSPSHINATKGSSVWLHWNYTYVGDGPTGPFVTFIYREQIIGFRNTSEPTIEILANKTGQNGTLTLELPVPALFSGRVEVISSNSTLVIHGLQYNDSTYQYLSIIEVIVRIRGGSLSSSAFNLAPIVTITVHGIPDFINRPPSTYEINEDSNLQLEVAMDGNPQPSAEFRWPHLTGSSPASVSSVQLYPFVYSSIYTMKNTNASYCGRILETRIKNSMGLSSVTASTNVTVLLKLDMVFDLKARKTPGSKCIEMKWNKAESGACYVKYEVALRNASGSDIRSETGHNIKEMTVCNLPSTSNITHVQLTVSFKGTSTNVTANVIEASIIAQASTSSGSNIGLIVGASVGGAIFLITVIIIVWLIGKPRRRNRYIASGNDNEVQDNNFAMAGEVDRKQPPDPAFAHTNRL